MINRFAEENKFLSNFYLIDVYNQFDGYTYKSVEHAYMSMKSDLPEWKEFCRHPDTTCGMVKKKSYELTLPADWEQKKLVYMSSFVGYKFSFHEDLTQKLIATGNQNLVEGNYHGDIFWGVTLLENPNIGENHLGRILMDLRTQLQIEMFENDFGK